MIVRLVALALASAPTGSSNLRNGDFGHGTEGWQIDNKSVDERFSASNGRAQLRLSSGTPAGTMVIAIQKVDAEALRGKSVELTAKVRLHEGSAGIRFAAVHDNPTRRLVRVISPAGAIPDDGNWHLVRVHGRISADVDYLNIGLYGVGATKVEFDDVRLGAYVPPRRPMSAYANTVLSKALDKIHRLHINARNNEHWPELEAQARRDAAGAQTTADLAPAISALLGDLNEHHAVLDTPEDTMSLTADQGSEAFPRPSVTLIDGKFGNVILPGLSLALGKAEDATAAHSYISTVREGLESLDTKPVCGWIVDLRGDFGGSTHVMASAVAALALFDPKDWPDEYAKYADDPEIPASYKWLLTDTHHRIKQGDKPIAVLMGPETGSAGEDTALRFIGRPQTRTFGSPTGGFTSGNETIALADGYTLTIPSSYMHDRHGNEAKDRLMPDEETDDPVGAAKRWLASQCS